VLDIVDARTQKLVWMGILEKEVQSVNPPGKRIQKATTKLLKNFPPKKKEAYFAIRAVASAMRRNISASTGLPCSSISSASFFIAW